MELSFQSSVLITNKYNELKDFYINKLKIPVKIDFGACVTLECGLSIWELSDNHTIAKHLGYKFHEHGNKNLELCFEADDFDAVVIRIKQYSPKLLHDIEEETWGQKTIRFYDPDMNLIEIGETIPCFIKRLHNNGMTTPQIVQKTSVPENLVKGIIGQ